MLWRRRSRWAAALALAAALAVPAAPVRAAGPETPGELVGVWDVLWQWLSSALDSAQGSLNDPQGWTADSERGSPPETDSAKSDSDHGSFIDPNG